ncbi:MAG: TonB-dependent receptor, partial [Bacteroidales bacterium]|nr:TonB-dependent receptor [Bacteroidales bacterium]
SIMKDATATALYGARGANGVIFVTTKRGQEGPAKISARVERSISQPTQEVQLADAVTYMRGFNEAIVTRDPLGEIRYSYDKIDNTGRQGNNWDIIYPNVDWYHMLFKNSQESLRANVSMRGGGTISKYYVAGSYSDDNGMLNVDKRNNFNNNISSKKYSLRANVDINVTKTTRLSVRLSGNFDDYTGPYTSTSDLYNQIMHTDQALFLPYYTPHETDEDMQGYRHIMFGNYDTGTYYNPYAAMVRGYQDYNRSQMIAAVELNQDLSFITKGLSAMTLFNLTRLSDYRVYRYYNPYYYQVDSYDSFSGEYKLVALNPTGGTDYLGYSEGKKEVVNTTYSESRLTYNREFGKHTVGGLLVFTVREQLKANQGNLLNSLPIRNAGLSGRFTYGYDSRYFAEFNFGYNGSERFSKSQRWGFFPSAGAAWVISNEPFFKPLHKTFSNLKLRYSYGIVGNDEIGGRFNYISRVDMTESTRKGYFGEMRGVQYNGIEIDSYANEDITWEKSYKHNVALELGLFKKLDIIAEYWSEHRKDIYMTRADIPNTMGLQASVSANVGEALAHGIDIQSDYRQVWNKHLWTSARGNFTFARGTYSVYEEPVYEESYRQHAGRPINQMWGYIAERLFVDDEEAYNSPSQQAFGSQYGGGDIKYTDVNGDGQITSADRVPIGNPYSPEIIYGFGFSAGYKGFDASIFFQGSANQSIWLDAQSMAPFVNNTQLLQAFADSHWSEDNRDIYALWPRYSSYLNANNTVVSTWWMRDASFLRLKQLEFGYTLPQKVTTKLHIDTFRVYMNGSNLLCFSPFKLWDPELGASTDPKYLRSGMNYPLQRTFNIGVNITLK